MNKLNLFLIVLTLFSLLVSCSKKSERKASSHTCNEQTLDLVKKGVDFGFDNDSALFYLKKAEELDSMCYNVNSNLVTVYTSLSDFKSAYHVSKRILSLEPDNPQHLMRVALLSHLINNKKEELSYLSRASESYKKFSYNDFYVGNDEFNKLAYAVEIEVCNLLLGDETATNRINDLISEDTTGSYMYGGYYNLTPEKYYDFLQNGNDNTESKKVIQN